MGADARRRDDGAQVADRVAPAVVELLGLDDDPGQRAGGGAAGDRHHRRRPTRVPRRAEGRVRRRRAAFVGDPDDEAAGRRGERQLEGLLGPDGRVREAGRVGRLAQDLGRGQGGMLGGPAAGDDDRLTRLEGRADGLGQLGCGPARHGEPLDDPRGERRFGGDHVGHVIRRTCAPARRRGALPGIGWSGERGGRVEGGFGGHRRLQGGVRG